MLNRSLRTIAAVLAIVLALAACGAGDDTTSNDETATSTDETATSNADRLADQDESEAAPEGDINNQINELGGTADAADDSALIAEPDDAPPEPPGGIDSVVFDDHGVSAWIDTADQVHSTFQTDADVASLRLAETWLERGVVPPPNAIRAEEWINALDHDHAAPEGDEIWQISADAGQPLWAAADGRDGTRLVRVGLRAATPDTRQPASITFVVDVSGSMSTDGRLDDVVQVISDLTRNLDEADRVSVVTFSNDARVLIEHTNDFERVRDALATLRPDAATNTGDGVLLGHAEAAAAHRPGDSSSVVVFADGMANRGITDPDEILEQIDRLTESPARIVTHTVGIGQEVYNDALLERLANASGGTYAYIDGPEHAERLLTRDLPLLHPIAHDTKAQVTFDPAVVRSWRLIGYENRLIAAEDLRDDTVTGAYAGAGHQVTALYEVDLDVEGPGDGPLGEVVVRWADPDSGDVAETTAALPGELATTDSGSPTWTAAAGMAATVEALRSSPHAAVELGDVVAALDAAGSDQDRWVAELVTRTGEALAATGDSRQTAPTP